MLMPEAYVHEEHNCVKALSLTFLCLVLSRGVDAQTVERILVPLWSRTPTAGAFGALWTTEITILNASSGPVQINGIETDCVIALCPPTPPTPAGVTFSPNLLIFTSEVQGFFLDVPREQSDNVHFSLRVRDLSRQAESWGTEVPVVRERDFFTAGLQLLDVPVRSTFRQMIRIYDVDPRSGPAQARVRIYGTLSSRKLPFNAPTDPLLSDETITFQYAVRGGGVASHPGYVEIGNLATRPEISGLDTIRIQIDMLTPNHRYWAFVSVTNNATQQVTTISPQ